MTGPFRIAVGGGGTGGHVIPALAIIRALRELTPEADLLYIGAPDSLEERLTLKEAVPFAAVKITGLRRGLHLENLLLPATCSLALVRSLRLLKRHRTRMVIGTGGFSSWPAGMAARCLKVPYVLLEQNANPGLVTKLLVGAAQRIYLGYPECARLLKVPPHIIMHTGNPGQLDGDRLIPAEARDQLGIDPDRFTLFVTGGSGGALTLNRVTDQLKGDLMARGWNLIWQTGKQWQGPLRVPSEFAGRMVVERFLDRERMNAAYRAADLVMARCGAITLAELALAGLPAILVPFPFAAGGHQEANARAVEVAGGARVILDRNLNRETMGVALDELTPPLVREQMSRAMAGLARPEAARKIAEDVISLMATTGRAA